MSDLKSVSGGVQVPSAIPVDYVVPVPPTAGVFFTDVFESGDLSGNTGTGNWFDSTDLVSVSNLHAKSGSRSLAFDFRPGASSVTTRPEVRFYLGALYNEVWLRFDLRVPENFYHDPTLTTNHKFFYIWGDLNSDYSNFPTSPGISTQAWDGGSGRSKIRPKVITSGTNTYYPPDNIIFRTSDAGKWMEIIFHVKQATSKNNDGIIQVWRQTAGESRVQIANITNGDFYQTTQKGFNYGYLFGAPAGGGGWRNSTSIFYMDNVVFSTNSLL